MSETEREAEPETDAERLCSMAEALETIEATRAAILEAFRAYGFPPEGARFSEFLGFLRKEGPGYAEWALDAVRGTTKPATKTEEEAEEEEAEGAVIGLEGPPDTAPLAELVEDEGAEATEAEDLSTGDLVLITQGAWRQITGRVEEKIPGQDAFRVHVKLQSKETSIPLPRKALGLLEKGSTEPLPQKPPPAPASVAATSELHFSNPLTLREAIMCIFMTGNNAPLSKKELTDGVKQILPNAVDEKIQATILNMCSSEEVVSKDDWPTVLPPSFVLSLPVVERLLAATDAKIGQEKLYGELFDKV